jgi:hypothetical protein
MDKVKKDSWYTLQDIVRDKIFPWVTSFWAIRNIVKLDREKENILKATIVGVGRGTKYHFKGENIIKFIKKVESGNIKL